MNRSISALYDEIADWFDQNRYKGLMEKAYLDLIFGSIPPNGSILDLGCGSGEPIARYFIEHGYALTGIDGAPRMIELCRRRFPAADFLCCDMRTLALNQKFDVVIAWDSFFHLDHDDQKNMFPIFASHIRANGILVFTAGPEHSETWGEIDGHRLYHASLAPNEYQNLLDQYRFKTLLHKIEDPDCGGHTIWVAQMEAGK